MTDLEIIKELEKELGFGLEDYSQDKKYIHICGYIVKENLLTNLFIYKKGIKKISKLIFKFKNLKILHLPNNEISEIPKEIFNLPKLNI